MKKQQKNVKSPQLASDKQDKHTYSSCYSITIRTGHGILLGSDPMSDITDWFTSSSTNIVSSILVRELSGIEEHFQGGIFYETPVRQDKIRDQLLPLVINLFKLQQPNFTTKALDNLKKHALKIVAHTNYKILYKYCTKSIEGEYSRIEVEIPGPWTLHELNENLYCEHNYPYWADTKCKYGPCYPDPGIKNYDKIENWRKNVEI